jgi:endonuclease III
MIAKIVEYFDILFPNPKCELNYNKDYELLIAVMLSAQTTDRSVNKVTEVLFKRYSTIKQLACANQDDIIDIIRPIGTFQRKSTNIINISKSLLKDYNGIVPNNREYLESLNGVGRKTTNVVLSNLFEENCLAVDTHVSRVSKRLGLSNKKDDVNKIEKKLTKRFKGYSLIRLHHQLVLFGRYYCKAKNPECDNCHLRLYCKEINRTI